MSRHKKVTWKVDRATHPTARPLPYMGETKIPEEKLEEFERALEPGGLFVVKRALITANLPGHVAPPHPFLVESAYAFAPSAPEGSLAIYAGIVRVEEGRDPRQQVRVPRHSFIINGCQYLIVNLGNLEPVLGVTPEEVSDPEMG